MPSGQLSEMGSHIVNAIDALYPPDLRPIALHEPTIGEIEERYVLDCLRSGFVSSVGKYVSEFEERLAAVCGVPRAVACVNGTAALHVCLRAMNVQPGEEVLIPAITFAATVNACLTHGAVPHIVDSDADTLGVDLARLADYLGDVAEKREGCLVNRRTGRRVAALVNVHVFGHCGDPAAFEAFARANGLALIEDAAESIGTSFEGRPAGSWGDISATSFNGNKTVTTGGGGAVLCRDPALADRVRHLTTTAKVPHRWGFDHDEPAYNYRMPNLNAALGCAQLDRLDGFLERKRRLQADYLNRLGNTKGLSVVTEPRGCRSNFWLCALRLENDASRDRDLILDALNDRGVMVRPLWQPMHRLSFLAAVPRMPDLASAEKLAATIINVPSSPFLAGKLAPRRSAA